MHAANSHDLLIKVVRDEWRYADFIMTDWTTTGEGGSSPVECMRAGNDLIVPRAYQDIDLIRKALEDSGEESLDLDEVKKCAAHLVSVIRQPNEYEDCVSYVEQFRNMQPYLSCHIVS